MESSPKIAINLPRTYSYNVKKNHISSAISFGIDITDRDPVTFNILLVYLTVNQIGHKITVGFVHIFVLRFCDS